MNASYSWKHQIATFQEPLFVSLNFYWDPEKLNLWISYALLITHGYPEQLGTGTGHTSIRALSRARPMWQILCMLTRNPLSISRGQLTAHFTEKKTEALGGRKAEEASSLDLSFHPQIPVLKKHWWSQLGCDSSQEAGGESLEEGRAWEAGVWPASCLRKMKK
ncbi:hypothetical protein LEMLEM_LOCUS4653 [Lemmus lemmus]